ncbi:MAG: hypothetical protein V1826_01585 [bacterium]
MDDRKLLAVASALEEDLLRLGYRSVRADHTKKRLSRETLFNHACWLVANIPIILADEAEEPDPTKRKEKAMRWLGFVQGVLVALGYCSIADMKRYNKPDDEPEEPPYQPDAQTGAS